MIGFSDSWAVWWLDYCTQLLHWPMFGLTHGWVVCYIVGLPDGFSVERPMVGWLDYPMAGLSDGCSMRWLDYPMVGWPYGWFIGLCDCWESLWVIVEVFSQSCIVRCLGGRIV